MAAGKDNVEKRVVAFAEQLGRLVGTVERRTEGWLQQEALKTQVAQIRDEAAELLNHLGDAIASGRSAANPAKTGAKAQTPASPASTARSGGTVDAPGKAHRKPAPSTDGANRAKHSGQAASKIAGVKTMRRPQRRG